MLEEENPEINSDQNKVEEEAKPNETANLQAGTACTEDQVTIEEMDCHDPLINSKSNTDDEDNVDSDELVEGDSYNKIRDQDSSEGNDQETRSVQDSGNTGDSEEV